MLRAVPPVHCAGSAPTLRKGPLMDLYGALLAASVLLDAVSIAFEVWEVIRKASRAREAPTGAHFAPRDEQSR